MAYDNVAENFALLKRSLLGTFDFAGRSRRAEVAIYVVATMLLNAVFGSIIAATLPWMASLIGKLILEILLALPLFALFARRVHDQDRTGWWTLFLPIVIALNVYRSVRFIVVDPTTGLAAPDPIAPFDLWIGLPLVLAFLVLTFLPGTHGANRFGPDPRHGSQQTSANHLHRDKTV